MDILFEHPTNLKKKYFLKFLHHAVDHNLKPSNAFQYSCLNTRESTDLKILNSLKIPKNIVSRGNVWNRLRRQILSRRQSCFAHSLSVSFRSIGNVFQRSFGIPAPAASAVLNASATADRQRVEENIAKLPADQAVDEEIYGWIKSQKEVGNAIGKKKVVPNCVMELGCELGGSDA